MSSSVFSCRQGSGHDLVLLHGWGVNSGVWSSLIELISTDFRITCIDLPGFGGSSDCLPEQYNLASVSDLIVPHIPSNSVILGWSLGGLVASHIAINAKVPLRGLINVASSPKFVATDNWPGISSQVLQMFTQQLNGDFTKTLDRFLAIQAMGSDSARQDVKALKKSIVQHPQPATEALYGGLNILQTADLRADLAQLTLPVLNCYGKLDSLVPQKAHLPITQLYPPTHQTEVFAKASHAPFISAQQDFAKRVVKFMHSITP
ncbi:pimeloyl-ACP methyl ester esterase BioH [Neptunicella sp. SCSIO 80796]|uniref:pimeloyl-ACP methyl ester esterase BioH n=1 Tax=Neptunicella plasticusilytica TaxID=3117012 RepID=UPI003A4E5D37